MSDKLVSIILLTWNAGRFIDPCLDSINRQDYKPLELIVVDNSSIDGSPDLLREKLNTLKNIPWKLELLPANAGFAAGMNRGIAHSKGEYVLTLNQDVVMSSSYISRLVENFDCGDDDRNGSLTGKLMKWNVKNNSKSDIVDSAGHEIFKDRIVQARGKGENSRNFAETKKVFGVSAAAAMYSRDALDSVSLNGEFFDEDFFSYLEDIDLDYRLILTGFDSKFVHDAEAWHALAGSGGRKSFSIRFKAHTNRYLVWIKNESCNEMIRDLPAIVSQEIIQLVRTIFTSPMLLLSWFVFPSKAVRVARKGKIIYRNGKDYDRLRPMIQSGRLRKKFSFQ